MQRKEFLRNLGLTGLALPLISSCSDDPGATPDPGDGTCVITPVETAGPFPTKSPSTLVLADIRSDRTGVEMTLTLTIQNKNNDCAPLEGVIVDVWHCDKDGYYSEYGGSGSQSVNLTSVHFLRGRQTTDSNGQAGFTTIFPGWYPGRAPHIHIHIFDATGKSLLITQIAFPRSVCDLVYSTATQLYVNGTQNTSNESDNVFFDSLAHELADVEGNVTDGFSLSHTIVVKA